MRKVCRKCKLFVTGNECPLCKGNQFTESWHGRLTVLKAGKSEIAKKLDISADGDYVIKTR